METCRFCKQCFPDRKALDRHACPMAGGGTGSGGIGFRFVLVSLLVLAAVSTATWLFVEKRWAETVLGIFGPQTDPAHVRIANGAAALVFAAMWWRYLLVRSPWKKLALVGLALLVWALTMPSFRATLG